MIELLQDMHVHSRFSDGRDTIEQNVAEAERLGLRELGCVDHVRAGSDWVPEYLAATRKADAATTVALRCAVEAKLLDTAGNLDTPTELSGIDAVYAADHQVPLSDGPHTPREIGAMLSERALSPAEVLQSIVTSTACALARYPLVVIAHLFSVLPKVGLDEREVPQDLLEQLASAAKEAEAQIEISERWSCPSARSLRPFLRREVPLLLSTDSHRSDTIGRYSYCRAVLAELFDA